MSAKHTPEAQAALDAAWRTVDALGGTFDKADAYACGYDEALQNACAAIEKLGGRDPDPVRAELLEAARHFIRWADEPAESAVGMVREQEWLAKARAAIAKATGAP